MADLPRFFCFSMNFLQETIHFFNHTKVLLKSDASDRVWKVELDGDRLAGGWEEFSAVHNFRDGDVLVFRHDGDENFHVSVSSADLQHASPSYVDTEDVDSTDDGEDEDDNVIYDGDEDNLGNISVKKNKKPEAESCFIRACITRYSLQYDRLDLSKDFNVESFGEIDLVNEQGRRWTLRLAKNSSTGVFYIRLGWKNFCLANELSQGDLCKFKLVENGRRPVLWLCPQEVGNGHREEEEEECPEADATKKSTLAEVSKRPEKKTPSPFLTTKFTPNRNKTGQLYISSEFARKHGITKSGEIILLNEDGRKWSSSLRVTGGQGRGSEWFYLRRGWRDMCKANGVKVNDSFVLKLIWEDANPMFKFFSKIENNGKGNQRTRKRRACESETDVEKIPIGLTQALNRTTTNSRKLQRTQPKSCSVSDQVTNVKRGIVDTLNTVRQFRAELETREQNMEASLLEIDALSERILGISKILN